MTPPHRPERFNTATMWAERLDRFPRDQQLRRAGFEIAARPNRGPTLWRLGGELMTEEEAHRLVEDAGSASAAS